MLDLSEIMGGYNTVVKDRRMK